MKSSHLAFVLFGVVLITLPACGWNWSGHDKKETEKAMVDNPTVIHTTAPDQPIRVVLLDAQTNKGIWYIDTTRGHVDFLQDSGTIRVDGQLWAGPYRIVSR